MSDFIKRRASWHVAQAYTEIERQRLGVLHAPPPQPDPATLAPETVTVIAGFWFEGRPRRPGERVTLPRVDAEGLRARGKAK
jgi:hypothetical protein